MALTKFLHGFATFTVKRAVACGLLSLVAIASTRYWIFDLVAHFRIQYIVLLALALVLAFFVKRWGSASIIAFCIGIHGFAVYQSLKPRPDLANSHRDSVTVITSNLQASNNDFQSHIDYLIAADADLMVFQEYTFEWDKALTKALSEYPHKVLTPLNSPFGIALFSKYPLINGRAVELHPGSTTSIIADVRLDNQILTVLGVHPPPPMSKIIHDHRNRLLSEFSEIAASSANPVVVLGDFNITPWSGHYQQFLERGKLVDARRGHALYPTWPMWFSPLLIPIDHIAVSPSIDVISIGTSRHLRSDHRSLQAKLSI